MAINWTPRTAIEAIKKNDKESIADIGKRFPLSLASLVLAAENEGACTILSAIPENITVRKIEAILKDGIEETDTEDVDTDAKEEPKAEDKPKSKRGRKPKAEPVVEEANDVEEENEEEDPVALYKECKKAGLKVKARQSADYYKAELAKLNEVDDEDDDDDWGEEVEEEAPKKATKKTPKKSAKKPEPVVEEDEEDDDDWDI